MWGKDDGKYEHGLLLWLIRQQRTAQRHAPIDYARGLLLWLIRQQRTAQRHAPIDYARGYYGKPKRKKVRK